MKLTGDKCQCCACGNFFNRVSTFDKHRVGDFDKDRRCLSEQEMESKGWSKNTKGFWITSAGFWKKHRTDRNDSP